MWEQVDKELNTICKHLLKGSNYTNDLYEDLKQEVLIILFNDRRSVSLYNEDKNVFFRMVFGLAYNMAFHKGSVFNKKETYFKDRSIRVVNCDDLILDYYRNKQEDKEELFDIKKYAKNLSELDRLWLNEYYLNGCNISKLSNKTKINRVSISNRMKGIFKKIKQRV